MTDPRQNAGALTAGVPLLLFPLRLETRFMGNQLWVRVFPDDCLVDTFEAHPSTVEIESARRYWAAVWRAGGAEPGERAAWRNLVASHGAGRARWLSDVHTPANPGDRPPSPPAGTVLLVAAAEATTGAERTALAAYWAAAWRAGGAGPGERTAFDALAAAVGANRAAALRATTRPLGFDEPPSAGAAVRVAVADFPAVPQASDQSWSSAPRVNVLPDRLVCLVDTAGQRVEALGEPIRTPVQVGPDPSGPPAFRLDDGDLEVPDELRWLTDFDRAVQDGLGFRVALTPEMARAGADRVVVAGLRLGEGADAGAARLEELLAHHRDGGGGLSLIRQGTPTNNTEDTDSGFGQDDDPDAYFDELRRGDLPAAPPAERLDGRWLAESLGIDPGVIGPVPGAFGTDQAEARAMNTALWPATLGYFLDTMMEPVIGAAAVDDTRWFFTRYVSGRGALPAIRIGSQPYGILPAVAFSRLPAQPPDGTRAAFLGRLLGILRVADGDWAGFATGVRSLGQPGEDVDADLLDILGLHPASAEMHFRHSYGLDWFANLGALFSVAPGLVSAIGAAKLELPAAELLKRLGTTGHPAILDRYFHSRHGVLHGEVVDDRPPSETEPLRAATTDGLNYLDWLAEYAGKSLETVRAQAGFINDRAPGALLYLLARHAVLLAFHDAGVRLHVEAKVPPLTIAAMRREPAFLHVSGAPSESRWAALYKTDRLVTGDEGITVADHIARNIGRISSTAQLAEQVEALRRLAGLPTARLDRLFAEHVDLCAYRFDAWRLGYLHRHLERLRERTPKGINLGAFGWLEDVRPSTGTRTPVTLDGDLRDVFQRPGDPPLERDSANGGFIHAPSLNHAVTASVLRAGHLSHGGASSDRFAVNLSSERVREALATLDGMRNGQSLGALLGYRLERGLHDRGGITEVDRFILPLRKAFPLVADRLAPTRTGPEVPADVAAARNVVDGLRLVERATTHPGYPFGLALPAASPAEKAAIDAEVEHVLDVRDAIGDLALAESVHQAAQGRYDAAAGVLDTVTVGARPPEPEVVRTPTRGTALTHRLALHLDPAATAPAGATPRAVAEPRLDRWLAGVLPPLANIACTVTWTDPRTGATARVVVTMADLGLRPIDLLAVLHADGSGVAAELDDRILGHVQDGGALPADAAPTIAYLDAVPGRLRIFDVLALVAALRTLLRGARPLRPGDLAPAEEASSAAEGDVAVARGRIAGPLATLTQLRDDLDAHLAAIEAAALPDDVDGLIATTGDLFAAAARFGVPQTGWGFARDWRRGEVAALLARVGDRVDVWQARLADFDTLLAAYDALPAGTQDGERLILLRRAEIAVAAAVSEVPANLADLRAALPARRATFAARRATLAGIAAAPPATYADLVAAVRAALPLSDVDLEPFDLEAEAGRAATFAGDLSTCVGVVAADVRARAAAAATALAAHDAATIAAERVAALTAAAKAMFGEDAILVPDIGPARWGGALADARSGHLTRHLTGTAGVDFPVDEWLTGVARVRAPFRAWEQAAILASGFGAGELALTPLQLPFVPDDHWLALPFPPEAVIDRDRLLYTAHLPAGFDPAARQCGLLLDEWTEVLPGPSHETGIAAHFNRPSSEPPQALLLVTPTAASGAWTWADVTGALYDTLGLVRKRAVEPAHLDRTPYARFLPATVMAKTLRGLSIGLALAVNNDAARFVQEKPDG